jgi:hypothetical protein
MLCPAARYSGEVPPRKARFSARKRQRREGSSEQLKGKRSQARQTLGRIEAVTVDRSPLGGVPQDPSDCYPLRLYPSDERQESAVISFGSGGKFPAP